MLHLRSKFALIVALAAVALTAACANQSSQSSAPQQSAAASSSASSASEALYDPQALPTGPLGASIKLGHDILNDTPKYLPHNVVAGMSCSACHVAAGTQARAGSLVGVYARFPQWNKRAKRMITLQDRIAECFLYSMNGTPPAYTSKEMIAMVSYMAYLSRKVPTGQPVAKDTRFIVALPSAAPNVAHGDALYAQKCSMCHQANGAGIPGQFPALWGATSFNKGAGMAKVAMMAGFVRYNMPLGKAGTLSDQQAYDVAAFVESHKRPAFDKKASISFPPEPASFF